MECNEFEGDVIVDFNELQSHVVIIHAPWVEIIRSPQHILKHFWLICSSSCSRVGYMLDVVTCWVHHWEPHGYGPQLTAPFQLKLWQFEKANVIFEGPP